MKKLPRINTTKEVESTEFQMKRIKRIRGNIQRENDGISDRIDKTSPQIQKQHNLSKNKWK